MKRNIVKSICFILILGLLLSKFVDIFKFKYGDGIYDFEEFYTEKENSIDVICFGSSHVFENINPSIFWDEYGITVYDLCGSMQPIWNTYYYMKEALKTQKPKIMVVDVFGVLQTDEYVDHSRIIKNNYGLNFSKDKIASIKVSSPKESWVDYILEYPTYHTRYTEISREDFTGFLGNRAIYQNWKGFVLNDQTVSYNRPIDFYTNEIGNLTSKVELYLQKIMDLSKEVKIPLLLIKSPYPVISLEDQKKYNRVSQIAKNNNIPFLNFNLFVDEIGIDFSTDFADDSHLNYKGNPKYTRYLADYLLDNYNLCDHRIEKKYQTYDLKSNVYQQQLYNIEMKELRDIENYISKSQNENYLCVYTLKGDYKRIKNYEEIRKYLKVIGINIDEAVGDMTWIIENNDIIFAENNLSDFLWYKNLLENNNLMVSCSKEDHLDIKVNLNNTLYEEVSNGLNVLIFDEYTGTLVESTGFPIYDNLMVYKK